MDIQREGTVQAGSVTGSMLSGHIVLSGLHGKPRDISILVQDFIGGARHMPMLGDYDSHALC